jgi:hypothetical protein
MAAQPGSNEEGHNFSTSEMSSYTGDEHEDVLGDFDTAMSLYTGAENSSVMDDFTLGNPETLGTAWSTGTEFDGVMGNSGMKVAGLGNSDTAAISLYIDA